MVAWEAVDADNCTRCRASGRSDKGRLVPRTMEQTVYDAAGGARGCSPWRHAWHVSLPGATGSCRTPSPTATARTTPSGWRRTGVRRSAARPTSPRPWPTSLTSCDCAPATGRRETRTVERSRPSSLALDDAGLLDTELDGRRLRQVLTDYFAWGIGYMGQYDDSEDDVPAGLPLRRWSWDGLVDG